MSGPLRERAGSSEGKEVPLMKKRTMFTEWAYVAGLLLIAGGVVLMEKADFGLSMIVAPAYLLHRWLEPVWSRFSFGTAEYCFQALLLILMTLVLRRFRTSWLFSFVTAVIYGFVLDGLLALGAALSAGSLWLRGLWYVLGMLMGSMGVACMFRTYLAAEVYELFVKEVSRAFGVEIHRFKTAYDCVSCLIGLIMSFLIFGFGSFVGVSWGTIVCALVNGWIIGRCSAWLQNTFEWKDALPWRCFFTGEAARGSTP